MNLLVVNKVQSCPFIGIAPMTGCCIQKGKILELSFQYNTSDGVIFSYIWISALITYKRWHYV